MFELKHRTAIAANTLLRAAALHANRQVNESLTPGGKPDAGMTALQIVTRNYSRQIEARFDPSTDEGPALMPGDIEEFTQIVAAAAGLYRDTDPYALTATDIHRTLDTLGRIHNRHEPDGWGEIPSPEELTAFKQAHKLSGSQIASICGLSGNNAGSNVRAWLGGRKKIPLWHWRLLNMYITNA